jgi:hypothetical protein
LRLFIELPDSLANDLTSAFPGIPIERLLVAFSRICLLDQQLRLFLVEPREPQSYRCQQSASSDLDLVIKNQKGNLKTV